MQAPWYQRDPTSITLEEANTILSDQDNQEHFPNQFAQLIEAVQGQISIIKDQSKESNPLAWFIPSYEQCLKLNAWIYGIDYIVDFDANRIGKTAGGVVNAELWILPNDPQWQMFQERTDHLGRTYKVIPRPSIKTLKGIRKHLQSLELSGNPRLPLDDPQNLLCYKTTLDYLDSIPPIQRTSNNPKRTVWIGGPSDDWNKKNIVEEWLKWTPKHNIDAYSDYKHELVITYAQPTNRVHPIATTKVIFKSYDSEDTKWSGGAVDGIMLSEGPPQRIFNEVKQRYKYPAFASWDYTPYEPRNTAGRSALAHRVFKGLEQLPLNPYIYSGFGINTTPDYIMDAEKRADLIRNWEGKPEGDARIKGIFYSSSPVVLSNYDPKFHALDASLDDIRKLYAPRPLLLFRGIDPGWGHVTACAWMALAPDNTRYIYQIYSRSQRSISERCDDIITLSGNKRIQHPKNNRIWYESITHPTLTAIQSSFIDFHTFKTDEQTGRPFANNYTLNGLVVRQSVTFGPKERATILNDLLLPQAHLPHPILKKPPGGKLFFLCRGDGVPAALQKMENIFWQTFERGEKQGLTKDTIQDINDDELDAVCYVACPTLIYQSFVTSQNQQANGSTSTTGGNSRLSFTTGIKFAT